MTALAARLGRVAVISGRPLSFLGPLVPAEVDLAGLYGLERRIGGVVTGDPDAEAWRAVVDATAADARTRFAGIDGLIVEPKGLSLTVHTRQAPTHAAAVESWAADAATRTGLVRRAAKASVELHPPVATDKGTVVAEWAADGSVAIFVGDDLGDLAAFDALEQLRAAEPARVTAAVAVGGSEAPAALLERADLAVDSPAGVLELLQRLLTAAS